MGFNIIKQIKQIATGIVLLASILTAQAFSAGYTVNGNLWVTGRTYSGTTITAETGLYSNAGIVGLTLNTGQGANELYDMNQNVQTTDTVTFGAIHTTGISSFDGDVYMFNDLGIGTSNPASKLEIMIAQNDDQVDDNGSALILTNNDSTNNNYINIWFKSKLDPAGTNPKFASIGSQFGAHANATYSGDLYFGTVYLGTWSEKMRIMSTGTTSFLDNPLTNVGDIALDSLSSDGTTITIGSGNSNNIVLTDNTTIAVTLGDDTGDDFTIDSTAFVVKGNTGNVGIGTSESRQKLSVNGTIESMIGGIKFPDATIQTSAFPYSLSYMRRTNGLTRGSTNWGVPIYATAAESSGSDITYTNSATLGDSFLINTSGIYSVSVTINTSDNSQLEIRVGSTLDNNSSDANTRAHGFNTTTAWHSIAWTGYVASNERIWIWVNGALASDAVAHQVTIARIN